MNEATVFVESVDQKDGEKDGRAWTKFSLKDGNGEWYSTFDHSLGTDAKKCVGQRARIGYEVKGKFKNLTGIELVEESPISTRTESGEADWDLIGLRKTRCVLWEQMLPAAISAGIAGFSKATGGDYDSGQLAGFVKRYGTALRTIAEADIYLADPVSDGDEWIPFLVKRKPRGEDVEI